MKQPHRPRDARIPRARRLRRDVTDADQKLWRHLKRLSLPRAHFRRQATLGRCFADAAYHEARLTIEVDGGQHNHANGQRVLRFWNHDVLENVERILETINEALKATAPPAPDPSPPQAGGGEQMPPRSS